jgi:NADH-quinone oxidoreductase subunit L
VVRGVIPETAAIRFPRPTLLTEWLMIAAMTIAAALGLWLAFNFYLKHPQRHAKVAASWPRLDNLLTNNFYVDEIYDALFVNRVKDLSVAFALFDVKVIDGFGVDGATWLARVLSKLSMWWDKWVVDGLVNFLGKFTRSLSHPIRMFQTGVFTSYAVFILLGLVILLAYYGFHMQALVRSLR